MTGEWRKEQKAQTRLHSATVKEKQPVRCEFLAKEEKHVKRNDPKYSGWENGRYRKFQDMKY